MLTRRFLLRSMYLAPLPLLSLVFLTFFSTEKPTQPNLPETPALVPVASAEPAPEAVFLPPPVAEKVEPVQPKLAPHGSQMILETELRLSELGYWTGPVDGLLDEASRSALMAFQKVEGRKRTGRFTRVELEALSTAAPPTPLEVGYDHLEVDIARQVLFFVAADGKVSHVLPVSTGNGKKFTVEGVKDRAYTPRGRCTVYRKILGNREAPLGTLYHPNYLVGGIAIHGSPSIPPYPASHGCIRIPIWACKKVSQMIPVGTQVLVHEAGSFANDAAWIAQATRQQPANSETLLAASLTADKQDD